jgi:Methyltransferase domain
MNITNTQRIAKLATSLLARPQDLPRYLAALPIWKRRPVDLRIPWWSFAAIDFIGKQCRPEFEVFEYGSGGSTLFFAERCKSVTAVEDHAEWRDSVEKALAARSLKNAELLVRPYDFRAAVDFESSSYLQALGEKSYDLIVVDGQDWGADIRPVCFHRAESYIKAGGMIVVDDSWRYRGLKQSNRAKEVRTFESVGPCRVGVTSTDVYFY